jgi:hypothetical protein
LAIRLHRSYRDRIHTVDNGFDHVVDHERDEGIAYL